MAEAKRGAGSASARAKRGGGHTRAHSARLRESAEQFRLAQETLGIVTWVWDIATDRVQWYGNPAALLGLERGAFSGRFAEYLACLHPEDLERSRQTYTDCMRGRLRDYRSVERVIWPDESVHWVETYGRADYAEGKAVRMMGVVKEVTERKRHEERERQTRDKYEALFAASPEAIAIARREDGVMLEVNGAWERAIGYARAEAIGRPAIALGMWRDPAARDPIVARIDAAGSITNHPAQFVRRDGSTIDVLLSGATVDLDGVPCVVWSWSDVSAQKRAEEQVREAEHKFAALFESSPIGLIVTRPRDRRVVEINDAGLQILGLQRAQAIGVPTLELATILDRERFEQLRNRALTGERNLTGELAVVRRDGRTVDLLLSTALVQLEGEPHFVVSIVDVTEMRRAERDRIVADARYRRLFESAREGMFITAPDHTVVDANPAAFDLSGYTPRELIGRSAAVLYSEQELSRLPFRADLTARWASADRVLTRKDGRRVDIEVAAGPMPDGNVLAIVRDITERKRGETLLMNVARGVSAEVGGAFFRSLVEHLARELGADFAFIGELVQPEGDRVRTLAFVADGAIQKDFEYRLEGSPCLHAVKRRGTVIHPDGVAELFPEDVGLAKRGIEAYVGTSLIGADGSALGVLVVMHRKPIQRGSYWASMIEIFAARAAAEIERSRAEMLVRRTNASLEEVVRERTAQLEEANRELESYNFSISHDLRQPLNAITGFSELLRESGETGRGTPGEYVREIESNAARMEQMIEALLQLARAGRGALRRERVDARSMVESVLRDLAANAAAAVELGELPDVQADPVLLRQVWANLIGNALKYSRGSASPRIEIRGSRGSGAVEYRVQDNGIGFDMRHARRLFSAFQRLPSAAQYEGTGVGLAIVERIVRRHGGSISAEAQPGSGAIFRFSLPDEAL